MPESVALLEVVVRCAAHRFMNDHMHARGEKAKSFSSLQRLLSLWEPSFHQEASQMTGDNHAPLLLCSN